MRKIVISDIPLVQQIITVCKAQNLKHIIISPGSRNAPLAISFSNDPFFKCYSIVDERCAAFFGLGIAQQTNEPVALVCTSGSALLNYYPAIAEAFYSDIPLVVLSADRPKERIDVGDGQTIRQEHVFANHILYEANLENNVNYSDALKVKNDQLITQALKTSKAKQGPVHVNIPLYEPLYNTIEKVIGNNNVNEVQKKYNTNVTIDQSFVKKWQKASKKLIIVGVLSPNSIDIDVLDALLNDENVLLLTETTSNLYHLKAIPSIDQVITKLTEKQFDDLQPDLLLTFGGMVVSKRIKAFLRNYQPKDHWHVDEKKAYDTYGCLSQHFKEKPNDFLKILAQTSTEVKSGYQKEWLQVYAQKLENHNKYLKNIPFSDLKVFESIVNALPQQLHLQLSNSSTIRYAQLFRFKKGIDIFCNRGTSGIDGSTSTAIGAALIQQKQTLLITGDLSFLYDSNALWNAHIPNNFKIIVINNSGGGIFRILPGNKEAAYFSEFLETKHDISAKNIASMYNFEYLKATNKAMLDEHLIGFFEKSSKILLEIYTPNAINDQILLNYFD